MELYKIQKWFDKRVFKAIFEKKELYTEILPLTNCYFGVYHLTILHVIKLLFSFVNFISISTIFLNSEGLY